MANGIDLRGGDQVLNSYELFDTPFYAIYQGKTLKFYHDENDIDSGRELLQKQIEALQQGQSTAVFEIVYYTELNSAGKLVKENIKGSNTFRIVTPGVGYNHPEFGNPALIGSYEAKRQSNQLIEQQAKKIEELEEKIDLLLEQKEIEEDQETESVNGFQQIIGTVLSNPQIQSVLVGKLMNLVDTILPDKKPNVQIAGVLDETEVQAALRQLFDAGMTIADLQKLAEMSEKETSMFNFLLTQLRSK